MPQRKPEPRDAPAEVGWLSSPPMLYPDEYVWFVFVSSLDIMLTWAILQRGGSEVNPLAALVIESWGLPGAIGFKFALMLFVILACEIVGRQIDERGRRLARLSVGISGIPPAYSLVLLSLHTWFGAG